MTKFSNGCTSLKLGGLQNRSRYIESYSQTQQKSLNEVSDDIRLKRILKRAVERDHAPQSLFDSIKNGIRGE